MKKPIKKAVVKPNVRVVKTIKIELEKQVQNTKSGRDQHAGKWITEIEPLTDEVLNTNTNKNFKNILRVKEGRKTFNFLAQVNRGINRGHVQLIVQSIRRMGVVRGIIVVKLSFISGEEKWYVIDGQHLMNACLCEGLDIPYIIMDSSCIRNMKELIEVIAMLNTSSKKWQTSDYITAWGVTEPQYVELRRLQGIYNMELDQLTHLLHYNTIPLSGGGHIYGIIKDGSFKIANITRAEMMLSYIKDALGVVRIKDREIRKRFIASFANIVQGNFAYNHDESIIELGNNKEEFAHLDNVDIEGICKMLKKIIK